MTARRWELTSSYALSNSAENRSTAASSSVVHLERLASLKDRIDQLPIVVANLHSFEDGALNFLRHGAFFPIRFALQFQETPPNHAAHVVYSSST